MFLSIDAITYCVSGMSCFELCVLVSTEPAKDPCENEEEIPMRQVPSSISYLEVDSSTEDHHRSPDELSWSDEYSQEPMNHFNPNYNRSEPVEHNEDTYDDCYEETVPKTHQHVSYINEETYAKEVG